MTPPLSKRETQIMDIIYARGQATATQVLAQMPDSLSRAAIRTFLRILEDKGHLAHRKMGREYVFAPTQTRKHVGRSALRRVLDVFFDGSLSQALAAHLSQRDAKCTPHDLEKMAALIRKARKDGR